MLQLDPVLIEALHSRSFRVAVETNGTLPATPGADWICVSPKAGTDVVQRSGNELKLVWPQAGIDPQELEGWSFDHFLVQPMDCEDRQARSTRRFGWRSNVPNGASVCRRTRWWGSASYSALPLEFDTLVAGGVVPPALERMAFSRSALAGPS